MTLKFSAAVDLVARLESAQFLPSSLYTLCQSHDFEMLLSLALGTRIGLEPTEVLLVVFCLYFVSY
jgi:hypothetical protein